MNEYKPEQIQPVDETIEQERYLEVEASKKIRDFVNDPRLKFHFTTTSRMAGVLERGVLSYELAKRAGVEIREYMSARGGGAATENRSVSIVDREKNPGSEERDDWWIKIFSQNNNHVGFLLPDDIKRRGVTLQPNESLVQIRIRPEMFEGIFVPEREELYETIESRRRRSRERSAEWIPRGNIYGFYLLGSYFGYQLEQIEALDPEIRKLSERIEGIRDKHNLWGGNKWDRKEWPEQVREEIQALEQEIDDRIEAMSMQELQKIIGKPADEIREIDLLIYFARKYKLPLYVVSKDFKSQRVIWPEAQKTTNQGTE